MNAIKINGLNKTYKGKGGEKKALTDVDLTIPSGKIYGLLGPNGAGKSTLINILASLVIKSSGSVKIWGHDIETEMRKARSSIGVVPQEINLDPFFTPKRILDIQAGLYGVHRSKRRTDELLEIVGLSDKANAFSRALSGGMKRRLMIAKAMVHTPPILVLDEPTAGVDVELRQMLWENVRELNRRGTTILLTTHYLEEAEELCSDIAIINHGKIIANSPTSELLGQIDNKALTFTVSEEFPDNILDGLGNCSTSREAPNKFTVCYNPSEVEAGKIIEKVQASKVTIQDISSHEPDLEDIFIQLTKQ